MSHTSITFTVEPALREALEARARAENSSTAEVLHRAAEEYVACQKAFYDELDRLSAEADKGVFVSSEKVNAWFASLDTDKELSFPEPDVFVGTAAHAM